MKSIQVNLKFPSNSELKSQMKQVISYLEQQGNIDLKLDTKGFTKSLSDMSSILGKLKSELKNFGVLELANTGTIKNQIQDTDKLATAMEKVHQKSILASREREKVWQNKNADASNKDLDNEYKLLVKKQEMIQKLNNMSQPKIDALRTNDLVSPVAIDNLQNKLNGFNTDTATKEINEFKRELANLSSAQPQIVRLQNSISNLTRDMGASKNKYGSLVSKEDIRKSTEEINKLKLALKEITGGKSISNSNVSKMINEANGALKNLTSNAKESAKALRMTNNESMSLGQSLSSALNKFGIYASMAMVVRGLYNEIKNGIGYVNDMNKAMTNIQMITGKSQTEVQGLTDSYKDLAREMSSTNAETVKGAENFLRAGYDNASTKEMIRQNIIGSKISGQGQGENSEQIIAIKNAYDMQADSISHVNDVLSTLDDTSSTSYAEMAKILQYSAFAGKEAKVSFEELSTYASVVSSKTRLSAETIGNALKTVFTRYKAIKQGLKEDEEGGDISGVERVLGEAGVRIRSDIGTFKEFGQVLEELKPKLAEMSEVDRSKILGELGGVRQANILSSLVSNLDDVATAQNLVGDSAGSAQAKFEIYQQSTEAKLNTLKQSFETFYDKILNSETINGAVEMLTRLIETLTMLDTKTVVTGASFVATLMMMSKVSKTFLVISTFTKASEAVGLFQRAMFAMRAESAIASLSMGVMGTATAGLSAGFRVVTASIWANVKASLAFLATPLGLALSAIALVLGGLTYAFFKSTKEQKIFDDKVKENKESVDGLTESLKTLNSEGVAENLKPLQDKQDSLQEELANKKRLLKEIDALKSKGVTTNPVGGSTQNLDGDSAKLQALQGQLANTERSIASMNKEFKESGIIVDEVSGKFQQITDANKKMEIPNATKSYEEAKVALGGIEETLAKVNGLSEITPDLASELLSKYPEMEGKLGSVASVQDFLNSKVKEQVAIQKENYGIMMGDDADFYNSKLKNNEEWEKSVRQSLVNMGASQAEANAMDFNNFKTLNEMKDYIINEFGSGIEGWLSDYVGLNLEAYGLDIDNFQSAGEAKLAILRALNEEIAKVNSNMLFATTTVDTYKNMPFKQGNEFNNLGDIYQQKADDYQAQLNKLNQAQQQISSSLGGFGGNFNGFKPSSTIGTGTGNGGSYTPDNSGSDKDKKEKEVADLEKLSDRYFDLNNSLQAVENSLKALHTEMENADDETKIKLLQQEIGLLADKKKAMENILAEKKKESEEQRKELANSGFIADGTGNIVNANARLDEITAQANSLSGQAKEDAIKNVQRLSKLLKDYNEGLLTGIPKTIDEINDLKNATVSAQKEIGSILEKQRDEYIKGLEKETNKLKDELQKRKDLMNKNFKEEDQADELKTKQDNLNTLNDQLSQAMRTGDEELIKSIRQQIVEAQREVDNFIKDTERDKANDRFDEEQDKLDKDLQDKIDEITTKLSDEEILKLVQSGVTDLTATLDQISNSTKSVTSVFAGITEVIKTGWITQLDTFISKINSIKDIGFNVNLNGNQPALAGAGGIQIKTGDLIIQGNVSEDTLPDIQKMLDNNNNILLKEIDKAIKGR